MTATQTEFTATDAGLPVASLTVGPSALDRLLARGRIRGVLAMFGPAFVASVAYVDPGNFATNIQGGAQYGYLLLWVVLAANLMAMVVQYLSAKLGIVTGRALPELVRDRLPRQATWGLWIQGEIVAMATDVAEFIGAALGLNLLFGVPMLPAGLITGLITFAVLALKARGRRRFEVAIIALLGLVAAGFGYETPVRPRLSARPDPRPGRRRLAVPGGRDPRRHRDAARHLPAFGPDQRPHAQPR
jgi:manganese transport protein